MTRIVFGLAGALFVLAIGVGIWRFAGLDTVLVRQPARIAAPVDPALEERIRMLEEEHRALHAKIAALESRMTQELDGLVSSLTGGRVRDEEEETPLIESLGGFDRPMLLSGTDRLNAGLTHLRVRDLLDVFGMPASDLDQTCGEPTSPALLGLLETRDVGPFRVRMVRPALDSLERVLARVEERYPRLITQLQTYGGFCARLVRGSQEAISRHAFGLAIDVSIGGTLDRMGDGRTQFGLIVLHEYFRSEGWIWGAAYRREDSMHFEVSAELFQRWRDEGLLNLPEPVAEAETVQEN